MLLVEPGALANWSSIPSGRVNRQNHSLETWLGQSPFNSAQSECLKLIWVTGPDATNDECNFVCVGVDVINAGRKQFNQRLVEIEAEDRICFLVQPWVTTP